jgi:cytochrome c-type biogenesis protein CcmH/NrfG
MGKRLVVVLLLFTLVVAGCAQLMADSIEALIKQGLELLAQRKYDEAIAKFAEVIRRDPKAWNAWLYTARAYIGKGSWGDALASSRKALELAPSRTDVIPALAEALIGAGSDALRHGRFAEAVGHFTEYVRLQPADVQGYLNLGRAFLGNGAWGDALRTFVQGLGQTDASGRQQLVGALLDGGRQALAAGRAGSAVDFLREYVRHDSSNASAWLELGRAYLQSGQLSSAWSALERALQLNPNDPEASRLLRGGR